MASGDFEPFTQDYDYLKIFYDVQTADGKVYLHCWPNACKMHATDASGMSWSISDEIKVRPSAEGDNI